MEGSRAGRAQRKRVRAAVADISSGQPAMESRDDQVVRWVFTADFY